MVRKVGCHKAVKGTYVETQSGENAFPNEPDNRNRLLAQSTGN